MNASASNGLVNLILTIRKVAFLRCPCDEGRKFTQPHAYLHDICIRRVPATRDHGHRNDVAKSWRKVHQAKTQQQSGKT
jgi:hypothetical protein